MHPLYNPQAWQFVYNPQASAALLESSGWQDLDADPLTPRTSTGVPGLADGTSLRLVYLVSLDAREQAVAQAIQAALAQCGIDLQLEALPLQEFLAPGPDGPVFGRRFELAQYAWMVTLEPPCSLYLSSEIPGPYPDAPKGWGGVNSGGYSNPEYDQACRPALFSLPDLAAHQAAHSGPTVYAEDLLPSTFLARENPVDGYVRINPILLTTSCNLEEWDYAEGCQE
jgi:peptide/nickel transport system substrate-binding protein